jgi:hypothetical protein
MLESASQSEERGTLQGWEPDEIGASFDIDTEQVQAVYDAMQGKTIDGNRLINWEKRNPKREREDNSAERVQRHRDARAAKERHVTPSNADVTPDNATKRPDEIRVEEIREEKTGEGAASETPRTPGEPPKEPEPPKVPAPPKEPTPPKEPKKPKTPAAEDDRRLPFKDFMFSALRGVGVEPLTDASTWQNYESFLAKTRGKEPFTLEKLKEYFQRFIHSADKFHQRQGDPIRYFVNNVNGFMRNDNGANSGSGFTDARTAVAAGPGPRQYKPKQ